MSLPESEKRDAMKRDCWECRGPVDADAPDGLCDDCRALLCDCGTMKERIACYNCDDGFDGHDCGEDCCACLYPEDNRVCGICDGAGGWFACPSCNPNAFNDQ